MPWFLPGDETKPVITADQHVRSAHGRGDAPALPPVCVLFQMSAGLRRLREKYDTVALAEALPCFLHNPPCLAIRGHEGVCFTQGGYGAPAAVDTLETVRALGARKVIIAGMLGVFASTARVGDVVVPHMIRSEEGTSRHYAAQAEYAWPDAGMHGRAKAFFARYFTVYTDASVTTDAVYRQTYAKEAYWRERGCVGVDMEASALLSVAAYYGMPAVAMLLASDKHPIAISEPAWQWGNQNFKEAKQRFVDRVVDFAVSEG